jgi:hypothetical protein
MQRSLEVLGVALEGNRCNLGRKAIACLIASKLPCTLSNLQSLAGKLNHCAPFITDFKRKIRPIIEIMGGERFG